MPPPLSEATRQAVLDLLPSGKSCRAIAREVGVSPDSVSRLAKGVGHVFGRSNYAHAVEARKAYCAAARADFAADLFADLQHIRGRLRDPCLVYAFAGKDGFFSSETVDQPPPRELRDLASAVSLCVKTLLDIDRHDRQSDDLSVFGQWLTQLKEGES